METHTYNSIHAGLLPDFGMRVWLYIPIRGGWIHGRLVPLRGPGWHSINAALPTNIACVWQDMEGNDVFPTHWIAAGADLAKAGIPTADECLRDDTYPL